MLRLVPRGSRMNCSVKLRKPLTHRIPFPDNVPAHPALPGRRPQRLHIKTVKIQRQHGPRNLYQSELKHSPVSQCEWR
uniref:Uncharacterized protein n=2 Tax=Anguilla anguilla TaxID=7936 RepID=A0A0E9TU14_ANGAN